MTKKEEIFNQCKIHHMVNFTLIVSIGLIVTAHTPYFLTKKALKFVRRHSDEHYKSISNFILPAVVKI
jgi:hypothetical protein